MASQYTRDHLKIVIAKILTTLGWNSINSTPLEILTDIMESYMIQMTKTLNNYATEFGQTCPNLDHLGFTFKDMGVNINELEEYVKYVNFVPPPHPVPKYPLPKEDNLNFLKPGSKEVLTRPVHIHEHLPPMNPLLEVNETDNDITPNKTEDKLHENNGDLFKKPTDLPPPKPNIRREEEGSRPVREISSVIMTTSGFLSPAREGKLPDSRTPVGALDPPVPLSPTLPPPPPTPPSLLLTPEHNEIKKPLKPIKKIEKRKTDKLIKDSIKIGDEKPKKVPARLLKNKNKSNLNNIIENGDIKPTNISNKTSTNKINKALAAARLKTEKLNTTITPITLKQNSNGQSNDTVDKLFTEPDKKKINIFKKISNVKNEVKTTKKDESRESSPDLIIDEPDDILTKIPNLPSDVTIEPINPIINKINDNEKIDNSYFDDDDSQSGTPSTPKTPEISLSPPVIREKRKRKDNSRKLKKILKSHTNTSPQHEVIDVELDRPKTPEPQVIPNKIDLPLPLMNQIGGMPPIPFPFLANFGGPGLIPRNPLFSPLSFPPTMNLHNFNQKSYIPTINSNNSISNASLTITPTSKYDDNYDKSLHSDKSSTTSLISNSISDIDVTSTSSSTPTTPSITSAGGTTLSSSQIPSQQQQQHHPQQQQQQQQQPQPQQQQISPPSGKLEKKSKEHKKDKKDKLKKRNKKDKIKNKSEKKKLKEEKKEKLKKDKKDKRKDKDNEQLGVKITLKIKSPSPRPDTPETRKLNIKPIIRKDDDYLIEQNDDRKREASPGLAKISALVTGPPKPKTIPTAYNDNYPSFSSDNFVNQMKKTMFKAIPKIRTKDIRRDPEVPLLPPAPPIKYIDEDGKEVWICPACGRQDDGSPMIGCDGCDAWYHWVCVGIQVPPDESENWYCRLCLSKKNEDLQSDKQKKKRKKREKKD